MKEINYVFSIGYRCNSVQFLRRFEISKFSGPFDWMYIDLESALQNINNKFNYYLDDIVIINKNDNRLINIRNKNFNYIKDEFKSLYECEISYMNENYYKTSLPINQNFTIVNTNDLYRWNRICVFLHHKLDEENEVEKIKIRIQRFNEVYNNNPEKLMLFYISKIEELNDIQDEIDRIYNLYNHYEIKSTLVSIICSPNHDDNIKIINNCFFIIKNVPSYSEQFKKFKTDNNLEWLNYGMTGINFEKEYDIIKNHFDLSNLFLKEEV